MSSSNTPNQNLQPSPQYLKRARTPTRIKKRLTTTSTAIIGADGSVVITPRGDTPKPPISLLLGEEKHFGSPWEEDTRSGNYPKTFHPDVTRAVEHNISFGHDLLQRETYQGDPSNPYCSQHFHPDLIPALSTPSQISNGAQICDPRRVCPVNPPASFFPSPKNLQNDRSPSSAVPSAARGMEGTPNFVIPRLRIGDLFAASGKQAITTTDAAGGEASSGGKLLPPTTFTATNATQCTPRRCQDSHPTSDTPRCTTTARRRMLGLTASPLLTARGSGPPKTLKAADELKYLESLNKMFDDVKRKKQARKASRGLEPSQAPSSTPDSTPSSSFISVPSSPAALARSISYTNTSTGLGKDGTVSRTPQRLADPCTEDAAKTLSKAASLPRVGGNDLRSTGQAAREMKGSRAELGLAPAPPGFQGRRKADLSSHCALPPTNDVQGSQMSSPKTSGARVPEGRLEMAILQQLTGLSLFDRVLQKRSETIRDAPVSGVAKEQSEETSARPGATPGRVPSHKTPYTTAPSDGRFNSSGGFAVTRLSASSLISSSPSGSPVSSAPSSILGLGGQKEEDKRSPRTQTRSCSGMSVDLVDLEDSSDDDDDDDDECGGVEPERELTGLTPRRRLVGGPGALKGRRARESIPVYVGPLENTDKPLFDDSSTSSESDGVRDGTSQPAGGRQYGTTTLDRTPSSRTATGGRSAGRLGSKGEIDKGSRGFNTVMAPDYPYRGQQGVMTDGWRGRERHDGKGRVRPGEYEVNANPTLIHKDSAFTDAQTGRIFRQQREQLSKKLYAEFNSLVFKNRLPSDLEITWNPRLLTTAGRTMHRTQKEGSTVVRSCAIHLSCKALDRIERLRSTLLHEMCHVAQHLLEYEKRPPHGPAFQRWARIASLAVPDCPVSTTHNYEIFRPYRYACVRCEKSYSRHTKWKDFDQFRCGEEGCQGKLRFVGHFNPDGTMKHTRVRRNG